MGLFSRKTDDTKARIEELKKKIQAEQQAYGAATREQPRAPAAPTPPPAEPTPAPAPVQEVVVEERMPAQPVAPVYEQPAPIQPRRMPEQAPQRAREHISFHDVRPPAPRVQEQLSEGGHGVVLDLGEGMSLNVPVKSRMNLDEFLGVADKVRELQRLQRPNVR